MSTGGMNTGGSGLVPSGGAGGNSGGTGGVTDKPTVNCGGQLCAVSTNFCCWAFTTGGYDVSCKAQTQSCYGTDMYCDGPEDCGAGQICCGQLIQVGQSQRYDTLKCVNAGQCNYSSDQRVICGDTPSVCSNGTTCKQSSLLPGMKYCGY
jgi:hypothetical protein